MSSTKKSYRDALHDPPSILEKPPGEEEWKFKFDKTHHARDCDIWEIARLFTSLIDNKFILADQPILVSVDCERNDDQKVTEIGIAWLDHAASIEDDGRSFSAAKLISNMSVKHYRILETAGNPLTRLDSKGKPLWQAAYSEFCQSLWISEKDVARELTRLFGRLREHRGIEGRRQLIFIGHDLTHDRNDLSSVGYNLDCQFSYLADTQFLAWQGNRCDVVARKEPLVKIVEKWDIKIQAQHNGANDAVYTMGVLIGLVFFYKNYSYYQELPLIRINNATPSSCYDPKHPSRGWYEDIGIHIEALRNFYHQPTSMELLAASNQTLCNTCGVAGHAHQDCTVICFVCGEAGHGQHDDGTHIPLLDLLQATDWYGNLSYRSGKLALPEGRLQVMSFRFETRDRELREAIEERQDLRTEVYTLQDQVSQLEDAVRRHRRRRGRGRGNNGNGGGP